MELLAFFLLYFGLTFVWRSVVVYRKTDISPLVLSKRDDAYGYVGGAVNAHVDRAGMGVDGPVLGDHAGGAGADGDVLAHRH